MNTTIQDEAVKQWISEKKIDQGDLVEFQTNTGVYWLKLEGNRYLNIRTNSIAPSDGGSMVRKVDHELIIKP